MTFTLKQSKCKTCGGINLVPAGKLSGIGYDDCKKCRDKAADQDAFDAEELVIDEDGAMVRR